jgi:hypothetical protein
MYNSASVRGWMRGYLGMGVGVGGIGVCVGVNVGGGVGVGVGVGVGTAPITLNVTSSFDTWLSGFVTMTGHVPTLIAPG